MNHPLLRVELRREQDVLLARRWARQAADALGLDALDQTRFATAVSEIARSACQHAGGGVAEFALRGGDAPALLAQVDDCGPDLPELAAPPGDRSGFSAVRRLVDEFAIESSRGGGTSVRLAKHLNRPEPVGPILVADVNRRLAVECADDPVTELQAQNRDLLRVLDELGLRQAEVERLNRELDDTNRGVLALYAELDERAAELARASELKSRFLSNISHELRTPLNSILNVSRLLLDRMDGPLTPEQVRQVGLIRGGAQSLLEIVNDLLDIARIEAGKTEVRPAEFTVADLFAALRGMFRPLVTSDAVELVFGSSEGFPPLVTDEGKTAQILRNLVSNALKFTERGMVQVLAEPEQPGMIAFHVVDTGVGIAPEDQERIFEEFAQVENRLQRAAAGTGLGLPLSRRLAALLGGTLTVRSEPGEGSTFTLRVPIRCHPEAEVQHA